MWPFRVPMPAGVKSAVRELIEGVYWAGVKDGVVLAVVVCLLIGAWAIVRYIRSHDVDRSLYVVLAGIVISVLIWYGQSTQQQPVPLPDADPPKPPAPKRPLRPWGDRATVNGPTSPAGSPIATDLPVSEQLKNTGGTDGSGLCVFTSIEHGGRFQNVPKLRGLQQWMHQHKPGGGYPEKVDKILAEYAPGVDYVQYSGNDPSILDLAIKTGRMPSVTYGYGERYGQRIAHMVNLVFIDQKEACVLDNNFPGTYEWMSREEFLRRWTMGGGGWAVVLLAPPPPPVPNNGGSK